MYMVDVTLTSGGILSDELWNTPFKWHTRLFPRQCVYDDDAALAQCICVCQLQMSKLEAHGLENVGNITVSSASSIGTNASFDSYTPTYFTLTVH